MTAETILCEVPLHAAFGYVLITTQVPDPVLSL